MTGIIRNGYESLSVRSSHRGAFFFCTHTADEIRTMLDAPMQQCPGQPYTVQPCTQNSSGNVRPAGAGELNVLDRKRLVAKRAFDSVSVESVGRALCATGYPALRDIQIEVERGIVVLWGRVPTYHQKQVAQVMAQGVAGVRGIANGIEVDCDR